MIRQTAAHMVIVTVAVTLCGGCAGSVKRVPALAMSVEGDPWKEKITFFTDRTARCEFQHEAHVSGARRSLTRSYDVACDPHRFDDLLAITNYLSQFASPVRNEFWREVGFRCFQEGRQTKVFESDSAQYENSPIWRGLADQCRVVANADLFRAMACQEMAETLASSGEWKAAAPLYVDAVTRLVAWLHRKWWVGPGGILDDSGLVVSGLDEFAKKQPPEKVVDGCRDSWFSLWCSVLIPPPESHSEPRPAAWGAPASRDE